MVGFSTVGFASAVVVVLEFYSACWAVCDAHGLCSGEYLFSELSVFSGACSAHRVVLFFFFVLFVFVLGGGASQRQRDERLHRLTLLSSLSLLFFFSSPLPRLSPPRLSSFRVLGWRVSCSARAALRART